MADDELLVRAAIRDELSGPLSDIRRELGRVGDSADSAGRKANLGARGFDRMAAGAAGLAKMAGRTAVTALGIMGGAIGAVTAGAAVMGIKTAAAMQNADVAFTTMLGSGKKAAAFLKDLKKFAASTPFEFPELQTAASSLISAGIEADKVIPIMTTLGNVTSGMGTGSEGIQRATVALQQMTAAGKISAEDLNQLRDAGIPVYDLLAKATGKSKAAVLELAQSGKLGTKELGQMMKALETGKGLERFNGLMEKQSATLGGVWSTLKDTVNMGLADAFKPAIPILQDLTLKASNLASDKIFPRIKTFLADVVTLGPSAWDALKGGDLDLVAHRLDQMAGAGGKVSSFYNRDLKPILPELKSLLSDVGTVLTQSVIPAFKDGGSVLPAFVTPLGLAREALAWMADNPDKAKLAIEGLVVAMTAAKAITIGWNVAMGVKAGIDAISLVRLKAVTQGTKTYTVWQGIVTAAQWAWNVALTANPIGIVIVAIAALVAGLVILYKKSETARNFMNDLFSMVKEGALQMASGAVAAFKWLLSIYLTVFGAMLKASAAAFGWVPGLGPKLKTAAANFDTFKDRANTALDKVQKDLTIKANTEAAKRSMDQLIRSQSERTIHIGVAYVPRGSSKADAAIGEGKFGDTATSHARGRGGLASTLAAHARLSSGQTITNALVGGGGLGRGSGDHQAGRALDLVGPGLNGYAAKLRAAGGYAAFHGDGASRHLHAVYPSGDTSRSVASRVRASSSSSSGPAMPAPVVIGAGAIVVHNPASDLDLEAAVAAGIRRYVRDQAERS